MSNLQLVFAGEVLEGFARADVRRALGGLLKLDGAKLDTLFGGRRVVIKRGLSDAAATHWVDQFRAHGALLHALADPGAPLPTPAPTPTPALATGDPQIPPPAPIAVNTPPVTEEITCPACGERQPKRILCRACACDMPRGIAAKEEEAAAERARRREEFMKRHGVREAAPSRSRSGGDRASGYHSRLAEPMHDAGEDAPLFGLSFSGRIGRMRNFLGVVLGLLGLVMLGLLAALLPGRITLVLLVFGIAFLLVWACRLTVLRLHDVGHSGWWLPLFFVPYMGNLGSLALMLWPGNAEDNEHGAPPSQDGSLPAIAALVGLGLAVALSWNLAWSAFQRQVESLQAEAGQDEDEAHAREPAGPGSAELARALHSDAAADEFRSYGATPGHRAFAVSEGGAWGWHGGAARPEQAMDTALADCERRRRPYTPACQVVHLNDHWAMY